MQKDYIKEGRQLYKVSRSGTIATSKADRKRQAKRRQLVNESKFFQQALFYGQIFILSIIILSWILSSL